jgi:3,4-dihydroxyphthalate decarboxylase
MTDEEAIRTPEIAQQMLEAMGDRPVCLLAGHGLIVLGNSVQQAVTRAIAVNNLAELTRRAQGGADFSDSA